MGCLVDLFSTHYVLVSLPRLGRVVFLVARIITMFVCLYVVMFVTVATISETVQLSL